MSSSLREVHLTGKYVIWAAIITSVATLIGTWITISDKQPEEIYKISLPTEQKSPTNNISQKLEITHSFFRGSFIVYYTSETGEKIELGSARNRKDIFINSSLSRVGFLETPSLVTNKFESDTHEETLLILNYPSTLKVIKSNGDFDKTWDLRTDITINASESKTGKTKRSISNNAIDSAGWINDNTLRVYLNSSYGFTLLGDIKVPESGEYDLTFDQHNTITSINKVKSAEITIP